MSILRAVLLFIIVLGLSLSQSLILAADWPQWRGPNRDGVWSETGIVEKFAGPELPILWRAKISSGYCGPTVAAGRVYVMDRLTDPKQIERVHCFDAKSGRPIWSHSYERVYRGVDYVAGPRTSVTVHDDRAYSLGSMGDLFCFEAASGKIIWQKDCQKEYKISVPQWGISASPLVEGDLLIAQIGGADGACVVAFDKATGQERWRALNDRVSYSAPIVIEQAGKRVLVCWTGDNVVGLEPASGNVHWQHEFTPKKMVIGIATPVLEKDRLFVTSFYDGSLMLKVHPDKLAVEQIWRRRGFSEQSTDGLHSIIATPYLKDDHVYGVDSYGELRCLNANDGERIWENLSATPKARWSNIHMVANGDRVWMFNERGELIISKLSPQGYTEISRAKLIDPTTDQLRQRGGVCWSHPAFANKHVYARNDNELVCANLAKE